MSHIFYKILKKIREESDYTQQQIADLLGISIKQYQNYEKKTIPPHDKILKLNEIFETDLSKLIYQEKVPNPETESDIEKELLKKRVEDLEKIITLLEKDKEETKNGQTSTQSKIINRQKL